MFWVRGVLFSLPFRIIILFLVLCCILVMCTREVKRGDSEKYMENGVENTARQTRRSFSLVIDAARFP